MPYININHTGNIINNIASNDIRYEYKLNNINLNLYLNSYPNWYSYRFFFNNLRLYDIDSSFLNDNINIYNSLINVFKNIQSRLEMYKLMNQISNSIYQFFVKNNYYQLYNLFIFFQQILQNYINNNDNQYIQNINLNQYNNINNIKQYKYQYKLIEINNKYNIINNYIIYSNDIMLKDNFYFINQNSNLLNIYIIYSFNNYYLLINKNYFWIIKLNTYILYIYEENYSLNASIIEQLNYSFLAQRINHYEYNDILHNIKNINEIVKNIRKKYFN